MATFTQNAKLHDSNVAEQGHYQFNILQKLLMQKEFQLSSPLEKKKKQDQKITLLVWD